MNGKQENNKEPEFISLREAVKLTGIQSQTLRKLSDENKIKCYKTISGQRKFDKRYLEKMCFGDDHISKVQEIPKRNFIYARVSSKKQLDDLNRQIEYIKSRKPNEYSTYELITDVASGINFNRKGLTTLLDTSLFGHVKNVVIAHRDRLSRFGFEIIQYIIEKRGGKIIVLDDEKNKSSDQELAEDLLSIIHIYSCKQMGRRSYKIKTKDKDVKDSSSNEFNSKENN